MPDAPPPDAGGRTLFFMKVGGAPATVSRRDLVPSLAGVRPAKRIAETEPRSTADTGFHCSGTARTDGDGMAVVDPRLCVRSAYRLRAIDASVTPTTAAGRPR